jgi:hypothetical protein
MQVREGMEATDATACQLVRPPAECSCCFSMQVCSTEFSFQREAGIVIAGFEAIQSFNAMTGKQNC